MTSEIRANTLKNRVGLGSRFGDVNVYYGIRD